MTIDRAVRAIWLDGLHLRSDLIGTTTFRRWLDVFDWLVGSVLLWWRSRGMSNLIPTSQSVSDWTQMGQIRDFFRSDFDCSTFCSVSSLVYVCYLVELVGIRYQGWLLVRCFDASSLVLARASRVENCLLFCSSFSRFYKAFNSLPTSPLLSP